MRRFVLEPLGQVEPQPDILVGPTRGLLPTWAWVALAIGAAGATVGVVYYANRRR